MTQMRQELWTKGDFVDLSRRQRSLLVWLGGILALNVLAELLPPPEQTVVRVTATVTSLGAVYSVYQLMAAVLPTSATWLIIAYFVLSFVPFINLVALACLNGLAMKRLRASGVHVGVFGAQTAAVEALADDFVAAI